MKPFVRVFLAPLATVLLISSGSAQLTLRGVVSDSTTHEPLVGANAYLIGTALGGVTDREGVYRIQQVSAGRYSLRISYIGYATRKIPITLTGADTIINVRLATEMIEGSEVVVTGQMRGQVAAINQQITSNTVVNVISEEKIKELPDANAAEAIGRLPGVSIIRSGGEANKVVLRGLSEKYSTVTVDGMRLAASDSNSRDIDLSTLSQSSLAGIELYKALTPDKDADAIAGSVNLVTKKAPSERQIRFEVRGDYNRLDNTAKQYEFSGKYGERFFGDILGIQVMGDLERRNRSSESTNLDYNSNVNGFGTDYQITDFNLTYVNEIRKRGGGGLLLDINTPDSGSVRVSGSFNRTNRNFVTYNRNYPTDNTPVNYDIRDREQQITMFNSSVRGTNFVEGFTLQWGLGFTQSRSEFLYDFELNFIEPSELTGGVPTSGMGIIPGSLLKGPPESLIPYALNNFNKAYIFMGYDRSQASFDKERSANLDVAHNYTIGDLFSGTLKVGGKYRETNRLKEGGEYLSPYYINPFQPWVILPDGTVQRKSSSVFVGTRFSNLALVNNKVLASNFLDPSFEHRSIYDRYLLYPVLSDDALRLWRSLNRYGVSDSLGRGPEYVQNLEVTANYYDIVEHVMAGYAMNTLNFGEAITFIAGVRMEKEWNDYRTRYSPGPLTGFPTPVGAIKDTSAKHVETVWLPNFHLTFRPTEFMNIRLAAYKALARPDFNQRINSFVARNSGGGTGGVTLNVGNPNLKDAVAWNYEINTSIFNNTIGLVSLSAFYKEIQNMFHTINGISTTGQRLLDSLGLNWKSPFDPSIQYTLTTYLNSDQPTKVWGFEFEHQANLSFLPGLLSNIVLSYNLSIIRSETYVLTQKVRFDTIIVHSEFGDVKKGVPVPYLNNVKQKLEGQPELFGNVGLGYDIGGFSARVSVFFQGEYNQQFSIGGYSDQVVDNFSRWDFSAKQKVTPYLTLLLNVNNLTNYQEGTSLVNRIVGWHLPNVTQKFGLSGNLGVRLDL